MDKTHSKHDCAVLAIVRDNGIEPPGGDLISGRDIFSSEYFTSLVHEFKMIQY